jgi:apolipoprotein N-acyltransferase
LAPLITRFDRLSTDFYAGDFAGSVSVRNQRLGVLICYEVAFDQLWQSNAESADYLLILTNNATYGGTKQPWQQLNITKLQAISIGKPVIVASTSGISAIIDSSGEIQQIISKNESGTLIADLPRALNVAPSTVMAIIVNYFALGLLLSNLIYFSIRNVARRRT